MPTYVFLNNDTGEIEEHVMSYKVLDEFKETNPHLRQQVTTANIVGGVATNFKVDDGFKEGDIVMSDDEGQPLMVNKTAIERAITLANNEENKMEENEMEYSEKHAEIIEDVKLEIMNDSHPRISPIIETYEEESEKKEMIGNSPKSEAVTPINTGDGDEKRTFDQN